MVNLAKQARLELQILSFTDTLAKLAKVRARFSVENVVARANFGVINVLERVSTDVIVGVVLMAFTIKMMERKEFVALAKEQGELGVLDVKVQDI